MGEYVIFHVSRLDKFTGEQIVALDVLGKDKGILSHSYDVDREKLLTMIRVRRSSDTNWLRSPT